METLARDFTNTKPWGDLLYEEQHDRKMAFLQMPRPEWLARVNAYFNTLRGNGTALLSALDWFRRMEAERAAFNTPSSAAAEMDDDTRTWRVWKDMADEPWKYGTDIGEWIDVNEEALRGPKRWRVDAYWLGKVREIEEQEQEVAATKLQALWRGYQTREAMAPRFNCARCLAHSVCWVRWASATEWLCEPCVLEWSAELRKEAELEELVEEIEEAEREEADVCDDCGEEVVQYKTVIGAYVLCPDCVHDWEPCSKEPSCSTLVRTGTECTNHCRNCNGDMSDGTGLGYCSYECQDEWQQSND